MIPLCRIKIRQEVRDAIDRVLKSERFILGEETELFENEFAQYIGVRHAIAVSSGTAAIFLSLKSLGIGLDDEVLIPAMTFKATENAVLMTGAKIVFSDIEMKTFGLDIDLINYGLAARCKAIIAVYLHGHPVRIDLLRKFGIPIIEDACQAHGAELFDRKCGSLGDLGCFSFFPSKCLTTLMDGGMVTTNDDNLARAIRQMRNQGRSLIYKNQFHNPGFNMRISEMAAAIGRANLKFLDSDNLIRKDLSLLYNEKLHHKAIIPIEQEKSRRVYTYYAVRTFERNEKIERLRRNEIQFGIHYPMPLAHFPMADKFSQETLSLPMSAFLSKEEVEKVCACF